MKNNRTLLIIGGAVLAGILIIVIAVVAISRVGLKGNATNNGKDKESALSSQYLQNQNVLSDCIVKVQGVAGVATANADKTNQILTDAVKGRYIDDANGQSSADPSSGKLFSAIAEAYPNLDNVNGLYEKVANTLIGCREDYKNEQTKLLSMLDNFKSWMTSTRIGRKYASTQFPDDDLIARIPGQKPLYGKEAMEKMYEIVVTSDTVDAYTTGTIPSDSGDPFATTTTRAAG